MKDIRERFIRILNERYNGNQSQFASKLGLTQGHISNIVNRGSKPSSEIIAKIIEVSDISAEWLLIGKGSMLKNEASSNNYQTGDINTNLQGHFEGPITNQIGSGNMVGVEKARAKAKDNINRTEYEALKQENAALKAEVERLKDDLLAEKERLIKIMLKE